MEMEAILIDYSAGTLIDNSVRIIIITDPWSLITWVVTCLDFKATWDTVPSSVAFCCFNTTTYKYHSVTPFDDDFWGIHQIKKTG
jgi:hypothetical protein